ncbi:VacJ family lipoprotein [Thiomicrospira sp. ALE5]|uniref:MlaA family lipoprotein n=1 Tax=Thiomicrospira sp. ALE5 TaxID=748650 RepID=UPI0008EEB90A|nr:VacJ family lipoprotein [Thiomicrospira sp. ALE5]SFR56641.1 phospholipid-binding lipoprotein MlaA [Thiomicrospira sp. ALE5]
MKVSKILIITISLLLASFQIKANEGTVVDLLHFIEKQNAVISSDTSETQYSNLNPHDPYENFNRRMFRFNLGFHQYVGEPVGTTYKRITPQPIRTGIRNFFTNLRMPINMVNNALQGNAEGTMNDIMRFSVNTVFGFGGLLDIATPAGLAYEPKDFGQTLYVWNIGKDANFLVLPFLGASSTRDLAGLSVDYVVDPGYRYFLNTTADEHLQLTLINQFDRYVDIIDFVEPLLTMDEPYIFFREASIQMRKNRLYNGNPPLDPLDDFDFD